MRKEIMSQELLEEVSLRLAVRTSHHRKELNQFGATYDERENQIAQQTALVIAWNLEKARFFRRERGVSSAQMKEWRLRHSLCRNERDAFYDYEILAQRYPDLHDWVPPRIPRARLLNTAQKVWGRLETSKGSDLQQWRLLGKSRELVVEHHKEEPVGEDDLRELLIQIADWAIVHFGPRGAAYWLAWKLFFSKSTYYRLLRWVRGDRAKPTPARRMDVKRKLELMDTQADSLGFSQDLRKRVHPHRCTDEFGVAFTEHHTTWDWALVHDLEGRVICVSESYAGLLGYEARNVIGHQLPLNSTVQFVHTFYPEGGVTNHSSVPALYEVSPLFVYRDDVPVGFVRRGELLYPGESVRADIEQVLAEEPQKDGPLIL
jgi:hypothetical protein